MNTLKTEFFEFLKTTNDFKFQDDYFHPKQSWSLFRISKVNENLVFIGSPENKNIDETHVKEEYDFYVVPYINKFLLNKKLNNKLLNNNIKQKLAKI